MRYFLTLSALVALGACSTPATAPEQVVNAPVQCVPVDGLVTC